MARGRETRKCGTKVVPWKEDLFFKRGRMIKSRGEIRETGTSWREDTRARGSRPRRGEEIEGGYRPPFQKMAEAPVGCQDASCDCPRFREPDTPSRSCRCGHSMKDHRPCGLSQDALLPHLHLLPQGRCTACGLTPDVHDWSAHFCVTQS